MIVILSYTHRYRKYFEGYDSVFKIFDNITVCRDWDTNSGSSLWLGSLSQDLQSYLVTPARPTLPEACVIQGVDLW